METTKRILVACGAAIATSAFMAASVKQALADRGITVEVETCKSCDVTDLSQNADLILTTTPVGEVHGKPVIETLAFITGIGKDAVVEQIVEKLME